MRHSTPPRRSRRSFRSVPIAAFCIVLMLTAGIAGGGAGAYHSGDDFRVTTVFLVRHAEKGALPPEDPPLLEQGVERSRELARVLGNAGIKAIYTSQYLRTKQTAVPLADRLGIAGAVLPVRKDATMSGEISRESVDEVVERIITRAGDNALIVGHSNTLPALIRGLGGDEVPVIDEKAFDDLFVVTVYAKGKARVTRLKYGDRTP